MIGIGRLLTFLSNLRDTIYQVFYIDLKSRYIVTQELLDEIEMKEKA